MSDSTQPRAAKVPDTPWRSANATAGMVTGFAFTHWVTIVKEDASRLWLVPLLISMVALVTWWRLPPRAATTRLALGGATGGWLAASLFGATFTFDQDRVSSGAWLALGHPPWLMTAVTLAGIVVIATGLVRLLSDILPAERMSVGLSRILHVLLWGSLVGAMFLAAF